MQQRHNMGHTAPRVGQWCATSAAGKVIWPEQSEQKSNAVMLQYKLGAGNYSDYAVQATI
jgi:hypothetical protein